MLTMLSSEITILRANIFKLAGRRIDYLDITGHVSVTIYLGELVERKVTDVGNVQFMVS